MQGTIVHIDSPEQMPSEDPFYIQGWIVSHHEVKGVWVPSEPEVELRLVGRPDVARDYPAYPHVSGFVGNAHKGVIQGRKIKLRYRLADNAFSYTILLKAGGPPLTTGSPARPLSEGGKKDKLALIAPYLICPLCKTTLGHLKTRCSGCGEQYSHTASHFNFLTEELREEFKIVDTENVSSHSYDPVALRMIDQYGDGLILDCGAGRRDVDYPNVINFEVVDYPSTDVLGVGERLPFRDETFDAAFSLAVLEHVKDPFGCAQEICRVLKKGGVLYCVVPFLQPVHGYPNHFYNMTSQGLRNMFEGRLDIIDCEVPLSGVPIWTLNWLLRSWADGLEGKTREDFLNMRVADLIGEPLDYLDKPFVRNLPEEKNFELACTTMIVGEKR